ncbi:MAG: sensor histidine kinase [Sphingomonadales bacterium]|nr:MAG: sensor histidine kinase [Sphingomonadales bacterium]
MGLSWDRVRSWREVKSMSWAGRNNAVDFPSHRAGHPVHPVVHPVRAHRRSRIQGDESDELVPQMGAMEATVLILDGEWRIIEGDPDWFDLWARRGYEFELTQGQSFKRYCEWCALWGAPEAVIPLEAMRAIDGGAEHFSRTYKVRQERRKLTVTTFSANGGRFAVFSRLDLTELFKLRRDRLRLEGKLTSALSSLISIRDDERERIARELHDGAAQCLVGIKLGLAHLRLKSGDPEVIATAADVSGMVEQYQADLRILTYMLYPPLLEQLGLRRALQALCATFTARSGIDIRLAAYGTAPHRACVVDAAIYRVVQEALSNVQKHASALRARVRLIERPDSVIVAVVDDGVGLDLSQNEGDAPPLGSGLGIPGMTSRAHELGARVVVHNRAGGRGTIVAASFPRQVW